MSNLELPPKCEGLVKTLARLYGQQKNGLYQSLLVNADVRIRENWEYDNWNGGTYGHRIEMIVPESLFLEIIDRKEEIESDICSNLGKLHSTPNEYFSSVTIELEPSNDPQWREASGLLIPKARFVPENVQNRIWEQNKFRVFLSHVSTDKQEVVELQGKLRMWGIHAFVAHEDIQPSIEWQNEIENALASMDAFVALMTEGFHESSWTDHEAGYALARGVPIYAVNLGTTPYGFIGKFQAVSSTWDSVEVNLAKIMKCQVCAKAFTVAMKASRNFAESDAIAKYIPFLSNLNDTEIDMIVEAYNSNSQIRGCYTFSGERPARNGHGILPILQQYTSRRIESNGVFLTIAPQHIPLSDDYIPF